MGADLGYLRIGRMAVGEWTRKGDDRPPSSRPDRKNRGRYLPYRRHYGNICLEDDLAVGLPLQVMREKLGRRAEARRMEARSFTVQEVLKKFDPDVTVEEAMVELVLETAKAAVARPIAVLGASLHQRESCA